ALAAQVGRCADMGINADAPARRPAEQLVDWHAEGLALDVPQGHVDAAQGAGEHRAAAVKGMAVDRLPVVYHLPRVLADQVGLALRDGRRPRVGTALDDGFAQADDVGVGVDLQEQPARLHQERFQAGDPQWVSRADGWVSVLGSSDRIDPSRRGGPGGGGQYVASVHGGFSSPSPVRPPSPPAYRGRGGPEAALTSTS